MFNEFIALRARARVNRDNAIAEIRREYETALEKIDALQQELLGKSTIHHSRISAAVEAVMPKDADFTTNDIVAALELAEPGRAWKKRALEHQINRLREQGVVRRLKRATSNQPALFVRVDAPNRGPQLEDVSLRRAIGQALTKPMNTTEVLVAVLESGYQTEMSKANLRHTIVAGRFRGRL
jgi:hypothetical protein